MPTYSSKKRKVRGGIRPDGVRFYTIEYQVRSSVINDEPDNIDDEVPFVLYQQYPTDSAAFLKAKTVEQSDELEYWTVTLDFDTERNPADAGAAPPEQPGTAPGTPGTATAGTAPELRPWVYKWGSVSREAAQAQDYSNPPKDYVNSAGIPFDPPLSVPTYNITLSITAWRLTAQEIKIRQFMGKVNESEYLGYNALTWLCTGYQVQSMFERGIFFWQVDVTLENRKGGWNPVEVLDAGTIELNDPDGSGQRLRAILDHTGAAVTQPVPLDGFGARLAVGGTPVYLEFTGYQAEDFSTLING